MVLLESTLNGARFRHEVLHEARCAAVGNAQHVVHHENLAVGIRACADPNDRHVQRFGHCFAQAGGHALQQNHRGACLDQHCRIVDDLLGLCRFAALHFIATQLVNGLRRQTQMGAHRYTAARQFAYAVGHPRFALYLDQFRACSHERRAIF